MQNPTATGAPSVQRCLRCSQELAELDPRPQCPYCGGLLELRHAPPAERGAALASRFRTSTSQSGVWRFAPLVLPSGVDAAVTWPEGNTPLIARKKVAEWVGLPALQLKHEGMNPTGSFKDRGMTVGVTQAVRVGATAVACASTGNTSASMAAYAALAGIPALVLVPLGKVALGKLTQSLAYGAHTLMVRGDFDDCLRLVRESSEELGAYLLNSINPYRIEGQKTIVLEMLEQLNWEVPDWIALPAGNLGNTAAFGKALREALEYGLITKLPRLLAVQSDGAAPFAMSFRENFRVRHTVRANTIATAINIGAPASYQRAVQSIRETNGVVTSVSDANIMEAKAIIDAAGVGCEPASAASVAGVRQMVLAGTIAPDARVVCVLTGHVLKDPESLDRYHRGTEPPPAHANRPIEIDATVSAVSAVMRTLRAT
jgi:threonine synthase